MARVVQAISTIALSWLLMQVIHEMGHVCGALMTGGSVQRVVLVPWEFSRTDLNHNPSPLITCWAGPIIGAVVPIGLWLTLRYLTRKTEFWFRFFAGFCLIANGAYIGAGAINHEGDSGDLLRHGCPVWVIWLFAGFSVPTGFLIWHGLGKQFGFGPDATTIRWRSALTCVFALALVMTAEVICAIVFHV